MQSDTWHVNEIRNVDLGDRRLDRRLSMVLAALGSHPERSIPLCCGSKAEMDATYRFFSNESVTGEKILASHALATVERMRSERVVLCLQDTTFVNFPGQRATPGLGPHSSAEKEYGLHLHPVVAVTPDRCPLGTLSSSTWVRDPALDKRKSYKQKPIEQKESRCWIEHYQAVCAWKPSLPDTHLVVVSDRESDIYELFEAGRPQQADWLIRAVRDRCLVDGDHIRTRLSEQPPLGSFVLDLPASGNRTAHRATLTVRTARVMLKPPYRPDRNPQPMEVTALLIDEENPPPDCPPVSWFLLTSLPQPTTLAEAERIANWYACRWIIERFFHVLKSGCRIEDLQLQTRQRLESAIATYMIIAWRILAMTLLGRAKPELPCTAIFSTEEWQIAHMANQRTVPTSKTVPRLQDVIRLVAQLGGYTNRKAELPPGPKTLWIGLQRLRDIAYGARLMRENEM